MMFVVPSMVCEVLGLTEVLPNSSFLQTDPKETKATGITNSLSLETKGGGRELKSTVPK